MPLRKFFEEGNRIGVFGATIYLPKSATDVDFTLFTHGSENPFSCAPQNAREVREYLESQFGSFDVPLDFTGRQDKTESQPYDIDDLPDNDNRLDGYFLTGRFFPDNDFLIAHYRNLFEDRYLIEPWL